MSRLTPASKPTSTLEQMAAHTSRPKKWMINLIIHLNHLMPVGKSLKIFFLYGTLP
jgi:hypothetical protein